MGNNKSTQDQLDYLLNMLIETNGQILAMGVAIRSLLLTHPDRERAIAAVTSTLATWETKGLYSEAPGGTLTGIARAKDLFLALDDIPQQSP